jgi:hypothetical protein
MGCGVTIVMSDSGGNQWLLGVADDGALTTTATSGMSVSIPILADVAYQFSWTLGVTTLGQLTTTQGGIALLSQNTNLLLGSPNNFYYYMAIAVGGIPQTTFTNIPALTPIVVGELFNGDLLAMYPKASQPGGIGTPVTDPVQTVTEQNGRFRPGCGHSIMSYDCIMSSVNCTPTMVIRCPVCGYVQRLMAPADFYNNTTNPILQA